MQTHKPLGAVADRAQSRNRDRRGVGAQNGFGLEHRANGFKNLFLYVFVFGCRLNHEVAVFHDVHAGRGFDAGQGGNFVSFAQRALAHLTAHALVDVSNGALQLVFADVANGDIKARHG